MIYCRHCGEHRREHARGLCQPCHRTPGVRDKYESRQGKVNQFREPTAAEVEAMIAERMANLPAWYLRECETRDVGHSSDVERAEFARNRFRLPRKWRAFA